MRINLLISFIGIILAFFSSIMLLKIIFWKDSTLFVFSGGYLGYSLPLFFHFVNEKVSARFGVAGYIFASVLQVLALVIETEKKLVGYIAYPILALVFVICLFIFLRVGVWIKNRYRRTAIPILLFNYNKDKDELNSILNSGGNRLREVASAKSKVAKMVYKLADALDIKNKGIDFDTFEKTVINKAKKKYKYRSSSEFSEEGKKQLKI